MADVFLSYARGNRGVAERLANSIREMGLTVWWDRHIKGGAEFSSDIERQLEDASKVLVLWSKEAVASRWVRDEASVAADTGRLISATIDGTPPPLGFRQFQTIDLTAWACKGAAIPPQFAEALEVDAPAPAAASPRPLLPRFGLRAVAAVALVGALLIAAAAWFIGEGGPKAEDTPVIAVLPFSDLSPQKDKAYFAEGVGEAILTVLSKEPGIRVIGRSTAEQLQNAGENAAQMRRALGVTHVLEGSARSIGDQLRMSVRLINASDGQQVWAEEYQRKLDNVFAVQDEIGNAVAARLGGSIGPGRSNTSTEQVTAADTYALYLAARAKMRERRTNELQEALGLARRAIAEDAQYAPAQAIYAEILWLLGDDAFGPIPASTAMRVAEAHARRAIRLAPNAADGYAALGIISVARDPQLASGALEKAIRLDPARADLRNALSRAYARLGRNEEAFKQSQLAVELEPLLPSAAGRFARHYSAAGKFAEAEAVLRKFEERGGSRAWAAKVRADVAFDRGDVSEAVKYNRIARRLAPDLFVPPEYLQFVGLREEALQVAANEHLFWRLSLQGDYDRLATEARSLGQNMWHLSQAGSLIHALAHVRDWSGISKVYREAHSAVVCKQWGAYAVSFTVVRALKETGRESEANRLLRCLEEVVSLQSRGTYRSLEYPLMNIFAARAQIAALRGNASSSLANMRRAVDAGYRTPLGEGLAPLHALEPLRATSEYRQLDARLKRIMTRERAETLRLGRV